CQWLTGGMLCSRDFATLDHLMMHLGHAHCVQGPTGQYIVCQWWSHTGRCDKVFRKDAFKRHLGTHVGFSFPCPECGKSFSRKDTMLAHCKKQHAK
ncbi:hypothetical protein EV363DRAFT_1127016, partial [Boletus edulis]